MEINKGEYQFSYLTNMHNFVFKRSDKEIVSTVNTNKAKIYSPGSYNYCHVIPLNEKGNGKIVRAMRSLVKVMSLSNKIDWHVNLSVPL